MDRRTLARELSMQAIYQLDVQGDDLVARLDQFFRESGEDDLVRQLARDWTIGTWKNLKECDELIIAAAVKWQLARLSQVDRAILRLSVYQLKFCPDVPPKVVINEAIEIAKRYSTEAAPAFINGVLDSVLRNLGIPKEAK